MESQGAGAVKKLRESENWYRWKWSVQGLLMEHEGTWEVCAGQHVAPAADGDALQAARKEYNRSGVINQGNRAARGVFARVLDSTVADLVVMCESVYDIIWNDIFE